MKNVVIEFYTDRFKDLTDVHYWFIHGLQGTQNFEKELCMMHRVIPILIYHFLMYQLVFKDLSSD